MVLPPNAFEAFLHGTIFDVGENKGMLVNNECSSWYNRVGDFFYNQFGIGENSYCTPTDSMHGPTKQPHSSRVPGQWH